MVWSFTSRPTVWFSLQATKMVLFLLVTSAPSRPETENQCLYLSIHSKKWQQLNKLFDVKPDWSVFFKCWMKCLFFKSIYTCEFHLVCNELTVKNLSMADDRHCALEERKMTTAKNSNYPRCDNWFSTFYMRELLTFVVKRIYTHIQITGGDNEANLHLTKREI